MYTKGHIGVALVAYAPLGCLLVAAGDSSLAAAGAAVAVSISMLPDVDEYVAWLDHRGVTHSIYFAVLVGVVLGIAGAAVGPLFWADAGTPVVLVAFAVGIGTTLSHIAADAITPMGIDPFLTGQRRTLDVVAAANPDVNNALFAVGLVAVTLSSVIGTGLSSL